MLTASPREPLGAPLEEIVVPRYLLYFAILPAMTTIALSILDPMLGMTLLGVFFVMWVVLRATLRGGPIRCQSGAVEDSVLKSRGVSCVRSDPVGPPSPGHRPVEHSRPKTLHGHGLTDRIAKRPTSPSRGHRKPAGRDPLHEPRQ